MDTEPSTHYHSSTVIDFNRAARSPGPVATIDLSESASIARAREETGLESFGDEAFRTPMRVLLESADADARLNPFGRFVVWSHTVRALKNRLWANACFLAHPEILERKIVAPIVIVGPHRSGTTRLQRMMAADTHLQHLRAWEGINPAPRLSAPELGRPERREEVRKMMGGRRQTYPGAHVAHPMEADWPEEETLLLNQSFCGFLPLGFYHVPGYYRWFLEADKSFGYRYMTDLMRLISWSRGDAEDKRWILKSPQHMVDLDLLLKVLPDARLVFTHRDPIKTVGSVMSLMWSYAVQHTDAPCRAQVRDTWLDFCERMARRSIALRGATPEALQLDTHYEDMNRDWRAVMQDVYNHADLDFSPRAELAMSTWLEGSNSENRHGAHRYALEDFGVGAGEVEARMSFVRERYAIRHEAK